MLGVRAGRGACAKVSESAQRDHHPGGWVGTRNGGIVKITSLRSHDDGPLALILDNDALATARTVAE
jgi:hypothetical protein